MDFMKNLQESQPDSQAETEVGQVTAADYSKVRQRRHEMISYFFERLKDTLRHTVWRDFVNAKCWKLMMQHASSRCRHLLGVQTVLLN